ncbi:Nicotinamide-nucleotide amidohydrolase PncC [BD1-7 clade bacterium]|uniref:CinA-like protein n=1 Tax=BD1-7 clade bacterium TaxID=2029982 RepID=A0A5S9PQC1_9GAMM|nr:Nicotinamide-nucleotide amidohydrolase PncC [BD1-7 clade bacterium]
MSNYPGIRLLMTGDELIHGDIIDTNYSYLATTLIENGLVVQEKCTVGDNLGTLVHQIRRLSEASDILLINGGLGPTQDDLTAEAMAQAFDIELEQIPEARCHVEAWCERRGFALSPASLKQATLPHGAKIFPSSPGSAAAFCIRANDCLVIATPGVPSELKHIVKEELLSHILDIFDCNKPEPLTKFTLLGIGESSLQSLIDQTPAIKDNLEIGFRAGLPTLELKYRTKTGVDPDHSKDAKQLLEQAVADHLIDDRPSTVAQVLLKTLQETNQQFCTAESCTGGMIASELTRLPGASAHFQGAIVSYSNNVKHQVLGVEESTLETHGAVSEPVAKQMLAGALQQTQAEIGVAVTGIAGPDGGSADKPVGTVWIAWGTEHAVKTVRLCVKFPRVQFQQLVSAISMELVRRELKQQENPPAWLARWS